MYLNAADRVDLPLWKRNLNQQALIRNNFFHQLSIAFSNHGLEADDFLVNRPDVRQLMMTSPKREKNNPFFKCFDQDERFHLLLIDAIENEELSSNLLIYEKIKTKIESSIASNAEFRNQLEERKIASETYSNLG